MRFFNHVLVALTVVMSQLGVGNAGQLAYITGVSFDGQVITWDALPEATGYNVYRDQNYIATVRSATAYVPDSDGLYAITGFDDEGNFSPLQDGSGMNSSLTNAVSVLTGGLPVSSTPENLFGLVYSTSAGEIFWDRVINKNYRYDITLNGVTIGSTNGTSLFLDALLPNTENQIEIQAFDAATPVAGVVSIVLDTRGTEFPYAAGIDIIDTSPLPSAPQRPRLLTYSTTAAELFWDAPATNENIVSTEISRNGVVIGSTPGNSFFDAARDPTTQYSYALVAINGDGMRSVAATVSGGPFEGDASVVINRYLTGITEIVANNPHQQFFPSLRGFTTENRPDDLTFIESTVVNETATALIIRSKFSCTSGTFTLEEIPSRFGIFRLFFSDCDTVGVTIDGDVVIANTDIGGYNVTYQQLTINNAEIDITLDGRVERSIGRAINFVIDSYDPLEFSISGTTGQSIQKVELQQTIIDNLVSTPRTTFTTAFVVNADWTANENVQIKTLEEFQDADLGNGQYLTGSLVAESSNGQTLTLDADTGDASRWNAVLNTEDASIGIVGNWSGTIKLPCLSVTSGDAAIPGCTGL